MNLVDPTHAYFRRAQFVLSAPNIHDLPPDDSIEIAVVGRSNVGKSSVLNALCDQRGLARTSRTPGRTQHIVVFDLAQGRRLLDLPGFGYAAVQRTLRAHWGEIVPRVLQERRGLVGLLLLADARAPLKEEELGLVNWCLQSGVPVQLALNKADKLNREAALKAIRLLEISLRSMGVAAAPVLVSATTKAGIDQLRGVLHAWYEEGLKKRPRS
jgi:GTP-binding protein